jgi:cytochrome c biogenesis protein CcmG/thiol:disulfide interchange protein DsbE
MKNRTVDRILLGGIGLLLVALVAVVGASLTDHVAKEGDEAPKFSIRTDSGRTVSPTDFGGKLLVLNFWATWCAPCVEEIPSLDQLQQRFKNNGLVVAGISVDSDEGAYKQFLAKHPVSFLTARDGERKISGDYGTFKYPETYIIDRTGRVVKKIVGPESWVDDRVVSYVQSLL